MLPVDLGSPVPRALTEPYTEFSYIIERKHYLPRPGGITKANVFEILLRRRSRRLFGRVSVNQLSELLWYTSKVLDDRFEANRRWQHRPTPSAGGCHPIDILLVEQDIPTAASLQLYDPIAHALCKLCLFDVESFVHLLSMIEQAIPHGHGSIVLFAAQFGRTLSRYEQGDSLVWRDAGALLASIGLVAEGLGVACCALGLTGEPWLSRTLGTSLITGVGGCIIGSHEIS